MSHWDECEECQKRERPGVVHIYGQDSNHDDAHIVGDVRGLTLLKEAIEKALAEGLGSTVATPADGEGYVIYVVRHETDRMDRLTLPYFDWMRYGREISHPRGRYPSSLVPYREDDEILGDDEWFAAQKRLGTDYEKVGRTNDGEDIAPDGASEAEEG